jgi:hypothetical protein
MLGVVSASCGASSCAKQQVCRAKIRNLTGVVLRAKIVDFCSEVTLEQRYENVEDFPIEALYPATHKHPTPPHHTTHTNNKPTQHCFPVEIVLTMDSHSPPHIHPHLSIHSHLSTHTSPLFSSSLF